MTDSQYSEASPLIPHGTPSRNPEPEPQCIATTDVVYHRFDKRATGIWSFCTEGTRIYFTILIASCLIAISDLLFKASLTALYKNILCYQQNRAKCHSSQSCNGENAKASDRELSTVFQWQSVVNAVGGFISISLWYWVIWPVLQRRQPPDQKNMTHPLLLSLIGFMVLNMVNIAMVYAAWDEKISVATFKTWVIWEQVVSFAIGGGPPTYWAYRENIIAAVTTPSDGAQGRLGGGDGVEDTHKPFGVENRQTGYVLLQVSAGLSQFLAGLGLKLISQSTTVRFMCLLCGLASIGSAFGFLLTLPSIPLPSPTRTEPADAPSSHGDHDARPALTRTKSFTMRDRVTVGLVLLSGIARSPLYSSIASNFAVLYISRRMDFDTSDAVLLIALAGILPPLIPVFGPQVLQHFHRRENSTSSISRPSSTTSSASKRGSTSSTYSTLSESTMSPPPPRLPDQQPNQTQNQDLVLAEDQEQNYTETEDLDNATLVKPSQIINPLSFLAIAIVGTSMMAFSTSLPLTHKYWFVLTAILFISTGAQYPIFTEPILAGWSAEGKKPVVFVIQQLINAVFLSLGALLLNQGFQREAGDGDGDGDDDHSGGKIGWTFMGITLVCVAASGLLVCAAWVSRNR
ncbi:hypothetical protein QBC37DRAFT_434064 [Rhypophila decipiens]|uniref:Uncharacterized protein n=1 Tax=Rhypophila decipiens TaxID=261697 RepID=A0AAN6XWN5_9PEZI|nr:hypothetical protein QBC37DRAFT_434064 [Rhypophila decipiens]